MKEWAGKYLGKWVSRKVAGAIGGSVAVEKVMGSVVPAELGDWIMVARLAAHALIWSIFLICQYKLDKVALELDLERVALEQPAPLPEPVKAKK